MTSYDHIEPRPTEGRIRRRLLRLFPEDGSMLSESGKDPVENLLHDARTAFLEGYRRALSAEQEELPGLFKRAPHRRRGFALEGAGMALALADEMRSGWQRSLEVSPTTPGLLEGLMEGRSDAEQTLIAIGVGWAGARLRKAPDWRPPAVPSSYARSVADGHGFHQGYFHSGRFRARGFPEQRGELADAVYNGLGRALWFACHGRPGAIANAIDGMDEQHHAPLWRGAGTACAFTGATNVRGKEMVDTAGACEADVLWGIVRGKHLLHALAQRKDEKTR